MNESTRHIDLAVSFLRSSIDPTTGGSRAYYIPVLPHRPWASPYPETTGYLIPTFLELANRFPDKYEDLTQKAIRMADWIVSLQDEEGGLPGGVHNKQRAENSIFNTAQMIIGLVAAYEYTHSDIYGQAALRAGFFLTKNQEVNGSWQRFNYQKDFSPSYYTRVAWPMLLTQHIQRDKNIQRAAHKCLQQIQQHVLPNGFVQNAGFYKGKPAFLHTIAYTIRGFLESGLLANSNSYWQTGYEWAYRLLRKFEIKKYLAGSYDEEYGEEKDYRCLTGEAQMVIIWCIIFRESGDVRFLNAACKLLDQLSAELPRHHPLLKKGGLAGSKPFYGKYMRFRQPNWATKFFVDACLNESEMLDKIKRTSVFPV